MRADSLLAALPVEVFAELLKQGAPENVATCSADTLVRDPVFAPIIILPRKEARPSFSVWIAHPTKHFERATDPNPIRLFLPIAL